MRVHPRVRHQNIATMLGAREITQHRYPTMDLFRRSPITCSTTGEEFILTPISMGASRLQGFVNNGRQF